MLPLNAEARKVVGSGTSLDAYQHLVHERYADKLPGSTYDKTGAAGGFDEPAAPISADGGLSTQTTALGLGGAGTLAAAGLLAVRRRRTQN